MATFTADDLVAEVMERDPGFRQEWDRLALARQVSALVLRYRAAHGLTQTALAERLGIGQSAVARLESGEVNPAIETLQRVSHRLSLPISVQIQPPSTESSGEAPSNLVLLADVRAKASSPPMSSRPQARYRGGGGAGRSSLPVAAKPLQGASYKRGAPASGIATKVVKRGPAVTAKSESKAGRRPVAASGGIRVKGKG